MMTGAGYAMVDIGALDYAQLESIVEEDTVVVLEDVPMRELEGVDQLTYQFTHPQFLWYYSRAVAVSFVWLFLATLAVSCLGRRSSGNPDTAMH